MDSKQLQRLLRLSQKTGSPLIISDAEGSSPAVLMDIDQYEQLFEAHMELYHDEQVYVDEPQDQQVAEMDMYQDAQDPYMAPEEEFEAPEIPEEFAMPPRQVQQQNRPRPAQQRPATYPQAQRSAQPPQQEETVGGEEQFYLEPIE